MADGKKKKSTEELDDMGMDFADLGDFDDEMKFDGEDSVDEDDRKPSRTKVATELAKAAGTGFFEELVTKSAKNSLPDSYESGYYEAMDLANFGKEVVDKNKEKLRKSTFKLGREVSKALPFKIKMLDDFIEKASSDYEQTKQQSEEEMRNAGIASDLTSIFDKQIEVQKAIAAQTSAEADVEKRERIVQGKMSQDVLSSIDRNTSRHTEFTVQIAKEYYRKSLELQYKSYFVQADMLRTMRDHYKGFSLQFTDIAKNTSLPEFVKLKNTERLQDLLRDHATQRVYDQMFTNSKFMIGLKKKMTRYVDDKVSTVTDAMDSATDILENLNGASEMGGGSAAGMLAEAGAGMVGGQLGENLADRIPQTYRDKIRNNKYIKTGGNYLSMLVNNPATLFKTIQQSTRDKATEFETDDTMSGKVGGMITGGLANFLDASAPDKENMELKRSSYLSHKEPAIFDMKVHRSLTEVIPLYLAKILKQNTDLTAMYHVVNNRKLGSFSPAEEQHYDFEGRKLDTAGNITKNIESSVFGARSKKNKATESGKDILRQTKSRITGDRTRDKKEVKDLNAVLGSKRSEEMLGEYIEKARDLYGKDISFEQLIDGNDPKLKEVSSSIDGLDKVLKALKDAKIEDSDVKSINARMKDSSRTYPIEAVKQLFSGASRLARTDPLNVVSDDTAAILSECFTRYIFNSGQPVTGKGVMSGTNLLIPKKHASNTKLINACTILISDLKKIYNLGDSEITSTMDSIFAILNSDLNKTMDSGPELFQNLQDLMPTIVSQRQVSLENAAEGLIGNFGETEYIELSEIRDMTRAGRDEITQMRRKSGLEATLDRAANSASGFLRNSMDQIRATGGDPFKMAELAVNAAASATTSATETLKNTAKTISDKASDIGTDMVKIVDRTSVSAMSSTIVKMESYVVDLNVRIDALKRDLDERQRIFNDAASLINDNTGRVSFARQSERLRKTQVRIVEANIKALEGTRNETIILVDKLKSIQANMTGSDFSVTMTEIREAIRGNVERVAAITREYQDRLTAENQAAATA